MGVDACIYVKTKDGNPPEGLVCRHGVSVAGGPPDMAYFAVENMHRLYAEQYPRGFWPEICGLLLAALGAPNTEAVYYQGDCDDFRPLPFSAPITLDDIDDLNRLWVGGVRYH